jgi:hypothetical protein
VEANGEASDAVGVVEANGSLALFVLDISSRGFETPYFLASFENISFSCPYRDNVLDATVSSTQQKDARLMSKYFTSDGSHLIFLQCFINFSYFRGIVLGVKLSQNRFKVSVVCTSA